MRRINLSGKITCNGNKEYVKVEQQTKKQTNKRF